MCCAHRIVQEKKNIYYIIVQKRSTHANLRSEHTHKKKETGLEESNTYMYIYTIVVLK